MLRLLIALMVSTGSAFAVECTQEKAVYKDQRGYVLTFEAKDYATTPYILRLENAATGDALIGDIVYGNGVAVPYVRFAKSCTEDSYGLECDEAMYEGVAYSLGDHDATSYIPDATASATKVILFPQSVVAFYQAIKTGELKEAPQEVFKLSSCR